MAIIERDCTTIEELWSQLSPVSSLINNLKKPIFRGQGDYRWHLTPTVFRDDIINKYSRKRIEYTRVSQVIEFEFSLLHGFIYGCDQQGISVPYDSSKFRNYMNFDNVMARYSDTSSGWPHEEFHTALAMAQHHGIPTRLLDWSKSSIVAMYFSASQALNLLNSKSLIGEKLAIWVIDANERHLDEVGLKLISTAGSVSANLAAQKGVFLLNCEPESATYEDVFDPNIEKDKVDRLLANSTSINAYKFTLPIELAGELLHWCDMFNVSSTSLFPGADGIAQGVLEFKLAKRQRGRL